MSKVQQQTARAAEELAGLTGTRDFSGAETALSDMTEAIRGGTPGEKRGLFRGALLRKDRDRQRADIDRIESELLRQRLLLSNEIRSLKELKERLGACEAELKAQLAAAEESERYSLQVSATICTQSLAQAEILLAADESLQSNLKNALHHTIPLWRSQQ